MTNLLYVKRAEIATALADVLGDGMFTPYPRPNMIAPSGWLEQPTGSSDGNRIVATFPVWFVYDGPNEAQVAGLDDVVAKAWAALTRVAQVHPKRWRPATLPPVTTPTGEVVSSPWRAVVIEAEATILAHSFCIPTVEPVDIPPALVQL
jgi:hypothetical protein